MSSTQKDVSKLLLIWLQGDNTAYVTGEYYRTTQIVRGKNTWVNQQNGRMMFYGLNGWIITSTVYLQQVLNGATGGLVSSISDASVPYEADWGPQYKVKDVYLSAEGRWVPVTDVYLSPSVHIWWSALGNPAVQREGITWFYNEVTVTETADSSFFVANGFTGGYMGIQDRSPKWIIFSVWDRVSTDEYPNASPEELVRELAKGKDVIVEGFRGEGTGRKSYLVYDWQVGQTYQFLVNVRPDYQESDKAVFTGWFRNPAQNIWRLLASFKVRPVAVSKKLEGIHSFLEDWASTGQRRQGLWGPAWIKSDNGSWVQATRGNGTTTAGNANNRNVFLSDDRSRLGMTTGGPALADRYLGPYEVTAAPALPVVLTLNPLPTYDGAPARVY